MKWSHPMFKNVVFNPAVYFHKGLVMFTRLVYVSSSHDLYILVA